jgi:hypothetical protein
MFSANILSLHLFIGDDNDSVAQLVEHYTFNVVVLGSNPSGITETNRIPEFVAGF